VRQRLLESFAREWPKGRAVLGAGAPDAAAIVAALDDEAAAALVAWLDRAGEGAALGAARAHLARRCAQLAADASRAVDERSAAARRLVAIEPLLAGPTLAPLLASARDEALVAAFAGALEGCTDAATADLLRGALRDAPDRARRACVELLLRRDAWHARLLDAVETGDLPRADLRADDRRRLEAGADAERKARVARLLGASNAARDEVYRRLLPAASLAGDPLLGRVVYDQKCAVCHRFGGAGGVVGPALDGMGRHPAAELLAEIVDPNRSVEANYRLWLVETVDEVLVSGRLVEETERAVELLDANGRSLRLERSEIAAMRRADSSVMPEGLVDDLAPEEIAALLAWLAGDGSR
jgi:hypothetical protein